MQERPANAKDKLVRRVRVPLLTSLGILSSVIAAFALWAFLEANGPAYDDPSKADILDTATTVAGVLFAMSGIIVSILWAASQSFAAEAEDARYRVEKTELPSFQIHGSGSVVHIHANDQPGATQHVGTAALLESDAQESMLTEIYSHGLAQAKVSFFVSIVFGMLGSAVLLTGVGLAIMHADSNGNRYAAIVTQTSGAVIDLLAGVFFLQSNRTRRDMGAQGVMLRDDGRFDRRLKAASVLSDNIKDEPLRDHVRAQMALQLVGGQLETVAPAADLDGSEASTSDAMPESPAASPGP